MSAQEFTVERANAMLPLVRRIVDDIVTNYRRWKERVQAFELATARSAAGQPDPDAETLQREAQDLARDLDGFVAELRALGVQF